MYPEVSFGLKYVIFLPMQENRIEVVPAKGFPTENLPIRKR